jgi:hypothetical protein
MSSGDFVQRKGFGSAMTVSVGADGGFQLFGGAMDAGADLLFGDFSEEAFARLTQELAVGVNEHAISAAIPATFGSPTSCGWRSCP